MATVYVHRDVVSALMRRYRYRSRDVAEITGLSAALVRHVTNGTRTAIEEDSARALAKAFRVHVSAISSPDAPLERCER